MYKVSPIAPNLSHQLGMAAAMALIWWSNNWQKGFDPMSVELCRDSKQKEELADATAQWIAAASVLSTTSSQPPEFWRFAPAYFDFETIHQFCKNEMAFVFKMHN